MNLRAWEHFLQIAESGSLSRVAEKAGISQPALSRQLRALEESLGARLFKRHGRGVTLTPAGEAFRLRADSILGQISTVSEDIAAAADEPKGRLAFGTPPVISRVITGEAAATFAKEYPLVRLRVRGAHSFQLREALLFRDIDVGILSTPLVEPEFEIMPFAQEQMVLIGPQDGALMNKRSVGIADVAPLPLIMTPRPDSLRIAVESALEAVGHSAKVALESEYAPMDELIRRGVGYTVLPGCAQSNSPLARGFPSVPIRGLTVTWVLAHLRGPHLSLAARKLIEMVREIARARIRQKSWRATYLGN